MNWNGLSNGTKPEIQYVVSGCGRLAFTFNYIITPLFLIGSAGGVYMAPINHLLFFLFLFLVIKSLHLNL